MLLAGLFSANLGIGEAARLELVRLQQAGVNVVGVDISPAFGLEEMPVPDGVVGKASAPAKGPLILHCNAPEAARALQYLGKHLTSHRHITGYWAWELEEPPHGWELAYKYLDALWVPSNHTAKAFSKAPIPTEVHPHVVQNILDCGHTYSDLGLPDLSGKHVCLAMADGRSDLVRKNIIGAANAFVRGCKNKENSALVIKLHHTDITSSDMLNIIELKNTNSNIHIIDTTYTKQQQHSLLHRIDTLLSLHRAEGFGLTIAEAIKIGKQVIATGYSGPMDYLTQDNSMIVPFTMIPVNGATTNYRGYKNATWAAPSIEAASNYITKLQNNGNF